MYMFTNAITSGNASVSKRERVAGTDSPEWNPLLVDQKPIRS